MGSRACTHRREFLLEPGARFLGMKVEGAEPAAVNNFSGFIEDIDALGPTGVERVGGVGHGIDTDWNREMETLGEIVGDGHALGERFRLRIADPFINV
jgi:hypothetical protein